MTFQMWSVILRVYVSTERNVSFIPQQNECMVNFFIVRRQKAPVLLYGMHHEVSDPQLFHTDENLTLLFNFVAVVKAHLLGVQGMPKIFLEMSQIWH